ncbi:MAG: TonB family protein [Candidatus Binatia bacterium]
MAEGRSSPKRVLQERSSLSLGGGGGLWRWVFFSSLLHAAVVWSFFVIPYAPSSRSLSYPVYTVELVGGEKLGGMSLGSVVHTPAPKKRTKKVKAKPPPRVPTVKKKKKKAVKSPAQMQEKVALKKPKREVKKEPPAEQGLPDQVRKKLIQAALERVRDRAEAEQKKQEGSEISPGPGEGEGADALGEGGRGGRGIIKGVEFLIYRNRMLYLIRERWTWVGKRTDLEVTVRFGIQESGEIVGLRILRASGDPSFDDSVFRAVKKASPLPPPPESYRKDFMDVELTFRPKDLGS